MLVIDCDVHHRLKGQEDLYPYLSDGWLDYVKGPEPHPHIPLFASSFPFVNPQGGDRDDAIPPEGGPAGSSLSYMCEQLVDAFDMEHVVLTGPGLYVAAGPNPYLTVEVARAVNDHMIERWLAEDSRFKGSVALANQIPEAAAKEIRRIADHPQIVQAAFGTNAVGHAFGHPLFDPIHRAAAEAALPLAIHALGDGTANAAAPHTASGRPNFYIEMHSGCCEGMMTHLMSFIFHGVFERYPDLRLLLLEGGVGWLPGFLRRLDVNYRGLRREVPWCKRLPSEYFLKHVRVTTQPLDIDRSDGEFWDILERDGFADVLVYASDYPHWDTDTPEQIGARVPEAWQERVLWRNAAAFYGLPVSLSA
jgi:predicted TIM-barrel fold metal-dependent hydrolase